MIKGSNISLFVMSPATRRITVGSKNPILTPIMAPISIFFSLYFWDMNAKIASNNKKNRGTTANIMENRHFNIMVSSIDVLATARSNAAPVCNKRFDLFFFNAFYAYCYDVVMSFDKA